MTKISQSSQAVEQEKSLTPDEHLKELLFQYVSLYESWSEDRKVTAKQGEDIEKFVNEFATEVDRFSTIEDAVIAKLKKSLDQTTASISERVHVSVSHAVDSSLDGSARKIKDAAQYAQNIFSEYQSSLNWSHWKLIALTVLSSIVTSLLIVWWVMPKPILPLTDTQIATYQHGLMLNSFWDKLTTRQKNWLLNLGIGKSNNREKLVEDVKKQYPDMGDEQANQLSE